MDAQGADGRSLPVSYSISGNVLTTHVDLSGSVAFPVLVDPVFYGHYGTSSGANIWNGWGHVETLCGGCFQFLEYYNLIQAGAGPGAPGYSTGGWSIYAPGTAGKAGSAGITRVSRSMPAWW